MRLAFQRGAVPQRSRVRVGLRALLLLSGVEGARRPVGPVKEGAPPVAWKTLEGLGITVATGTYRGLTPINTAYLTTVE